MKTETTLRLEDEIYRATKKQGVFGCFEVTIGWFGTERVDYLTLDTDGIWRCYEIKASVADFHSKAAKTFIGNYNYFVMPQDVYDKVKDAIPNGIGVIVGGSSVIKAKRRELGADKNILFQSMIRSLAREYQTTRKSQSREIMTRLERDLREEKRLRRDAEHYYRCLSNAVYGKYGREALRELKQEAHHE